MISFEMVLYKEYTGADKQLTIIDRSGKEYKVKLVNDKDGRRLVNDELSVQIHKMAFAESDLTYVEYYDYYLHQNDVINVKQMALRESIRAELMNNITAFARYYDYCKTNANTFNIYTLANYDVQQQGRSCIVASFDATDDTSYRITDKKLKGISPSTTDQREYIKDASVDAWRYELMSWTELKDICPEFVEGVLKGTNP